MSGPGDLMTNTHSTQYIEVQEVGFNSSDGFHLAAL